MVQDLVQYGVELAVLITTGKWISCKMSPRYTAGQGAMDRWYHKGMS